MTLLVAAMTIAVAGAAAAQTKAAAAPRTAPARKSADDPDQKELYNYTLSMDKVQKIGAASRELDALQKTNPALAADDGPSSGKTLSDIQQKLDKYPQVVAVLKKNGLTSREYAVGIMTLIQSGMAVGMKKSGMYKEYPAEMQKLVSPANLTFVEQHYDEITKAMPGFSGSSGK